MRECIVGGAAFGSTGIRLTFRQTVPFRTNLIVFLDTGDCGDEIAFMNTFLSDLLYLLVFCGAGAAVYFVVVAKKRGYFGDKEEPATPTVAIGEFPAGEVGRIEGKVLPTPTLLIAPLTGKACVAYRVSVSKFEEADEEYPEISAYQEIASEEKHLRFLLKDATGVAEVYAEEVQLKFSHASSWKKDRINKAARDFLARRGVPVSALSGLVTKTTYRFNEEIIRVGDRVVVEGRGIQPHASPETTPGGLRPVVVLGGSAGGDA